MPTTYSFIGANKRKSVLLVIFFVAFLLLLGWILDKAFQGGTTYIVLAAGLAVIMALASYFSGDSIILGVAAAHPITKEQNPYLYNIVENLSITAGLPMPKLYFIDDAAINAFATGRDPKHASIAVTRGAVEQLENEELEGVIAHELSHVGNYDVRFMMLVGVLVGIVAILSHIFLRSMWFGGGRRRNDNESGGIGNILAIVGIVLIILSPIIAQLIQLAVSRKREFLADASGALLTRYPEGLANALRKIAASQPLQHASTATTHLYISNPFGRSAKGMARMFSTHPPIEERIAALEKMSGTA